MYTPTFTLTHKIVHSLIKLELGLRDIKTTPLPQGTQKKIQSEMAAVNISCIAKLIGVTISQQEAEDLSSGRTFPTAGSDRLILSNYRSTKDFIYSSGNDPYLSLSSSLLLHLNKLLLNDVLESWEVGRFRSLNDSTSASYDTWFKDRPEYSFDEDSQRFFTSVLNWSADKKHHIHPILKIGCVIYELYARYPFVAGNQITFLAVSELLFEKHKISLRGLLPVARNVLLNESDYRNELHSAMGNKQHDLTSWLEHFTKSVADDVNSLKTDVIRSAEKRINTTRKKMVDLNSRQKKLMNHLRFNPKISRREYVSMTGVSTMTAYRDLNEMVKRKLITIKGGGRSCYYLLYEAKNVHIEPDGPKKKNIVKIISDTPETRDFSTETSERAFSPFNPSDDAE